MTQSNPPRGALVIYGTAVALASVIPVPLVDSWLGRLSRGSTMRRVAKRHGVQLSRDARDLLSQPGLTLAFHATRADRFIRRLSSLSNTPAKLATSAEDGVVALLSGHFLEHYLARRQRPASEPIDEAEATTLRQAMDAAVEGGIVAVAAAAPGNVGRALQRIGRALEKSEDRTVSERLVDSVLEELSDTPEAVLTLFVDRFERALDACDYCRPRNGLRGGPRDANPTETRVPDPVGEVLDLGRR